MSTLLLAVRYWQYIVMAVLAFMLALTSYCLDDSVKTMQLMRVTHDLETANNIAEYEMSARKIEQQNYQEVIDAINKAKLQQQEIAIDVRSANDANERLHQTIDQLNANSALSANDRAEYTASISELFKECSSAYIEMARAADGHASDIRLLQDARR